MGDSMQLIIALMKRLYWFQDGLQNALEPSGLKPITRTQAFIIGHIAAGEKRASKIAANLGVSRQAVSQSLTELEQLGYIELIDDPDDKRARAIRFKAEFAEEGQICSEIFEDLEEELARRIGQRRLAALRDSLDAEWGEPPHLNGRSKKS